METVISNLKFWTLACTLVFLLGASARGRSDSRDVDLRAFHTSHRVDFENYVRFIDADTLMLGFEAYNTSSSRPPNSRHGKIWPGELVYTVATADFNSGNLKAQHSFSTVGVVTLLPLTTGAFILCDSKRVVLYSLDFQEMAQRQLSTPSAFHNFSLSPDESLLFIREDIGRDSTVEALRTTDLEPVMRTVIPDLPVESFGHVVVDRDLLLISRPLPTRPATQRLYSRAWASQAESEFSGCPSGIPLLATRTHRFLLKCPQLALADSSGRIIATASQNESSKDLIALWHPHPVAESRNGEYLAFPTVRFGGGIEALDIASHVTHQTIAIVDASRLTTLQSIPIKKQRSVATAIALSPDGSRLAYVHGYFLSLASPELGRAP